MKSPLLSVEDRINAAIKYSADKGALKPPSVSRISKLAKVSRSNLYENHRDLVSRLIQAQRAWNDHHPRSSEASPQKDLAATISQLTAQNRALLYVCLELQFEMATMRANGGRNTSTIRKTST